jgi:predicted phage tail protein
MLTVGFEREQKSLMSQTETTIAPPASAASKTGLFHRIWPAGVIILAFILTAAWVSLLAYGLLSLIRLVF